MHMQALAMVAGGSVTVLSHPSLQGISSGSGLSGSTAWHGAFRFRQYLRGIKPEDDEQPDSDIRELAFKKNQYGPMTESIALRYQRGLFLPERGTTSLDKLARQAKVDETFLHGLGQIIQQGRDATAASNSPDCGPPPLPTWTFPAASSRVIASLSSGLLIRSALASGIEAINFGPKSGLLRKSRYVPYRSDRARPLRSVVINKRQVCVHRNGQWELLEVTLIAQPDQLVPPAYQLIVERHIDRHPATVGESRDSHAGNTYRVRRRPLSRRELLALPIPVEWLP
jgi:hypothetical protein